MKRKECRLLPHIREDLYGSPGGTTQFLGWQIQQFDIQSFWKLSQGEGVRIGVIDTGCDVDHNDIKDNIINGINIIEPKKDPIDDNGHGTHVAGTIAASNNSYGIVGIAPKASIAPIKALDGSGFGSNTNIAKAIIWACDNNIDLITMSLGSEYPSNDIEKAIKYAKTKKVIIFCAAGNSGIESGIQYPAKYDNTISTGAINEKLEICEFSCCGEELDFLAPGYNIVSSIPGNRYASMTGTSMANPFTVGCAALLLSYTRLSNRFSHKLETSDDYIKILSSHTTKLKDSRYSGIKKYEGYGIVHPTL